MSSKKKRATSQTEFSFTLPQGLTDSDGHLHRQGKMRLATARDEIEIHRDRRVSENPAYGVLVYLSRVITRLGNIFTLTPQMLENLTVLDLAYLREVYNRVNQQGEIHIPLECPNCQQQFNLDLSLAGESWATLQHG
jgi:hypothetical protein